MKPTLFILLFFTTSILAQSVKQEITILDSIFINHKNQFHQKEISTSQVVHLFTPDLNSNNSNLSDSIFSLKKTVYNRDLGLDLKSNFVNNQKTDIVNLDDNLPFKSRSQIGLEWNLLKSGLVENKSNAKKVAFEKKIDDAVQFYSTDKNSYLESYNTIIQLFNNQKTDIIEKRSKLLIQLNSTLSRLYLSHHAKQEDWLEIQQRIGENKSLNQIYHSYNSVSKTKSEEKEYISFPVFDINEVELLKYQHHFHQDSLEFYFSQINKLSNRWLNNVSLSPFTRYNYYTLIDNNNVNANRAFFSIGANLSIPLDFNRSKLKTLQELESKQKVNNLHHQHQFYYEELANELYEYRYQLYQYTSLFYKRKIVSDAITIENIKREMNPANYSPIKACKLVDDLYRIDIELVELNQNLYLKLLKVHEKNSAIPMEKLIRPFDLHQSMNDSSSINSIYIWSKTLQSYTSDFIFQYITLNNYNHVVLALQEDSIQLQNKLCSFLIKNNVSVELMIGSNKAFYEKDFNLYLKNKLAKADLKSISSIHLDIEPHTFPNWKDEKDQLLKQYLELVQQASIFAKTNDLKLSISIPLTYPEEVIKELFKKVDLVYFMAYENTKEDFILRKLSPFSSYKSKYVIALRTEDFTNRGNLDNYILDFKTKNSINNFAIHDLGRIILLDTK